MLVKRSIYPSIFNRLRAIARYWSEIATSFLLLAFNTPVEGVPIGIPGKSLVLRKLESWATRQWRQFDDRLSRFDTIPACDGRTDRLTDGQTDVQPISITCAVWLTHVKNEETQSVQTWYMGWPSDILEVQWFGGCKVKGKGHTGSINAFSHWWLPVLRLY